MDHSNLAQRSFLSDCKTIEFAATMKLFELLFFVPSAKSLLLQVPIKRRNSKTKILREGERDSESVEVRPCNVD